MPSNCKCCGPNSDCGCKDPCQCDPEKNVCACKNCKCNPCICCHGKAAAEGDNKSCCATGNCCKCCNCCKCRSCCKCCSCCGSKQADSQKSCKAGCC